VNTPGVDIPGSEPSCEKRAPPCAFYAAMFLAVLLAFTLFVSWWVFVRPYS
jgi:hypothetical protein